MAEVSYQIGVDVGGTHTDVVVVSGGQVARGKAFTTREDLSNGVMDGLKVVAGSMGVELSQMLKNCSRFVNGTTVVTNAVTELRGRPIGAIVTRGFRDTFRIARGPRLNISDDHSQVPVPSLVPWNRIVEVSERLDHSGSVVAPLAEDEVREAARQLVERGAEAIAIVFLWSFRNNAHEKRTQEIIRQVYPDLFTVTSSDIHPLSREFERWNTALFTVFVREDVVRYVNGLETKLANCGLAPQSLSLFQCLGGTLLPREACEQPLQLMDSGPVGGVIAARALANELGLTDLVCADMGGTSFDVAIIRDGGFTMSKRRPLGHPALLTGLASVDIVSIGAGGGSLGWIDSRRIPQVGPHSAGSNPGPACYGRGGAEPALTDAMVALNFIDPGSYLSGSIPLDHAAAIAALERLGAFLDWSAQATALGMHDIAVSNMVHAIREVSVHKGNDPRELVMLAYGGMTPLFACTVAERAGMKKVIVPPHSAAFSAWGVVLADRIRRYAQTVSWNLDDAQRAADVQAVADELVAAARADARSAGIDVDRMQIRRIGAFRFRGQVWEIDIPLEDAPLNEQVAEQLKSRFSERYEEIYGTGTAWKGFPVVMLDYEIITTVANSERRFHRWVGGSQDPQPRTIRSVVLPTDRQPAEVPVYDYGEIGVGAFISGPAIIDGGDTTIYVPASFDTVRGELGELELTLKGDSR